MRIHDTLTAKGFAIENTGGNCKAYVLRIGTGEVLVTDVSDAALPCGWPVYVGFYVPEDDSGGEILTCSEADFTELDFRAELKNLGANV